ncbi:MAG TPA: DUF6416 domain-containing protein [Streptosporangiaceae bacterium]|nr:DUF6416 domain-containing protein [Streptosporangiaceae bacterium]
MVEVTFEVPERLLGQFYIAVGSALKNARLVSREPDVMDWDLMAFDGELATMVWRKFSPRAQAVFSVLMDNPGEAIPADELAAKIGLANGRHGLAGVVAWPSRQCAEVHRVPLFRYEAPEKPGGAGTYWMDPRTAKLFLAARDRHLALQAEVRAVGH